MFMPPWIHRFRNRLSRVSRSGRARRTERLEDRTLLTVSGVLRGTDLSLFVDQGDDVTVQNDMATGEVQVLVNNAPATSIPSVQSSMLTSLSIFASNDDNTIDVSGITAVEFTSLALNGSIVIEAGDGNDLITGSTGFGESILGQDGNDTIVGDSGDDTIVGGDGNDVLTGGDGNDSVNAGDGMDSVDGGTGDDSIDGGDGADTILGGDGRDLINGGAGNDTIDGQAGDDRPDTLLGAAGGINGGSGDDSLTGGAGMDSILGGSGDDAISGGTENDVLSGQGGNDTILGEDGNDNIRGDQGADSLLGGDGNDTVNGNGGRDIIAGGIGNDLLFGGGGADLMFDDDQTNGTLSDTTDTINGNGGDDTIRASSGADSITGGSGDDLIDLRVISLSIDDVRIEIEGDSGATAATFTVTLDGISSLPVTVDVMTSADGTQTGGTATPGADFTSVPTTTLTFLPGQTTRTISVDVLGDTLDESDEETFFVLLSNATNAVIFDGLGEGRIVDDDIAGAVVNPTDIFFLLDDTSSFSSVQAALQTAFGQIVTDLQTMFPAASFGFGVGRFEEYTVAAQDRAPFILNQPVIETVVPNFMTALTNALGRSNPDGGGANDETAYEALFQIATGVGYDGNANANTTDNGPAGLVSSQIALGGSGDVPAFSTFMPDPTGPVLTSSGTIGGVGFRTGADHIVILASDAFGFDFAPDGIDPYTGFAGATVPAADLQLSGTTSNPAGGAQIQATIDALLAEEIRVITLEEAGFFGGGLRAPYEGISLLTGALNNGTTVINSGVMGDDIQPGEPLYFQVDAANPNLGQQLTDAIIAGVLGQTGGMMMPPPPPPPPAPPTQVGDQADTATGGSGRDTIFAGSFDDLLIGSSSNDSIDGGGGNDTILGGGGDDTLTGGTGDDVLEGQGGDDVLNGGSGEDTLIWNGVGDGDDAVSGDDGGDSVQVNGNSTANAFVLGQSIDGRVTVTEGSAMLTVVLVADVVINADGGDDSIIVTDVNDLLPLVVTINGDNGDDVISAANAQFGNTRVFLNGGAGNDSITGGVDRDSITGGDGDDVVNGGDGGDMVDGGDGSDIINGDAGSDTLLGGLGNDTLNGGDDNDSLTGSFGNDVLMGNNGDDTLRGGFGNDNLNGSVGNDLLKGGQDNDTLAGGSGEDSLDGGTGDDTVKGQSGADQIKGGDGNDRIEGNGGNDTIDGGDGADTVDAGNGRDIVDGGDGNDSVSGMSGQDTIIGSDGDDSLFGGGSNDMIFGGNGTDVLRGNAGTDRFNSGEGGQAPKDLNVTAGEIDDARLVIPTSVLQALAELNGF
jgi:Ca2+-binding RTX toxin-like protein